MYLCGKGAYSKIYHDPKKNEVTKVNIRKEDLFGINYPAEYDITCRLNHPHLLKAKRITPEGHLIFDYYPYTLWSYEILTLPMFQKKLLLQQLMMAVEALHKSGYLHLDIKGDNVLINANKDHLVLADFGAALFIGAEDGKLSSRERIIDDLKAPELLQNKIEKKEGFFYRRETDYWSLGLLCLEVFNEVIPIYRRKNPAELFTRYKIILKNDDYFENLIPGEFEWQNNLKQLLAWDWQKRKLPLNSCNILLIRNKQDYPTYELNYKHLFTSTALLWSETSGSEKIEAFFLATDLFRRACHLDINHNRLLFVCYWIALKIAEGSSIDPREIDPDISDVKNLWKLELDVIRELKGELYHPNLFTHAVSLQDLIVSWRYLHESSKIKDYQLNKYPKKTNLSLLYYLYLAGVIFI